MVIKASAAAEIRKLVQSLSDADSVVRETAVARLAVIGPRAVPHLISAYEAAGDRSMRAAILRALEPMGDRRAASVAASAIGEGGDVALAAALLLGGLLESQEGNTGADALDTLLTAALDTRNERRLRLAAMAILRRKNIDIAAAAEPPDDDGKPRTPQRGAGTSTGEHEATWRDALDGHLPDDPRVLREALDEKASVAPLSELRKLVDQVRSKESTADSNRDAWRALRGSMHQALAMRGSRVALYDLRETLESADTPLPPSFAAAVQVLGDSSCLDAIAAAYSRSTSHDDRSRHLLASAFAAIAAREKIGARHVVMKRISTKWPDAASTLWRTRPRQQTAARTSRKHR